MVRNLAKKIKIKKPQSLLTTKNIELRASELFAKPKNYGLKVPIHQDNYYWNVMEEMHLLYGLLYHHPQK